MKKKVLYIILICAVVLFTGLSASADGTQETSQLLKLFGESGVLSFHLEKFSFDNIDFDMLIRTIGNSRINFSKLNYDAFIELFKDPEILGELDIESIDEEALRTWLKDPATGDKLNGMMLAVRNGGSLSENVQALYDDPAFMESFSAITGGKEFRVVIENLASGDTSQILNKAAAALLSPRSRQPSETAVLLSTLVQNASDTLGWK